MQHQNSLEELDMYNSKALADFLKKYNRLSVADACMQTQDGLKIRKLDRVGQPHRPMGEGTSSKAMEQNPNTVVVS
jgi:hypothetical protein